MIRNVIPFLAKREDLGSLARSVLRCPPDDVHRNIFTIINEMPVSELQKRLNAAIVGSNVYLRVGCVCD